MHVKLSFKILRTLFIFYLLFILFSLDHRSNFYINSYYH